MFGAGFESIGKGMAAMVAFIILLYLVMGREDRLEREEALVRTDPIAAAETTFSEGEIYFYRWLCPETIPTEHGEPRTEYNWEVVGKRKIAPLILDNYPERADLLNLQLAGHSGLKPLEVKRAKKFAGRFNLRMAELAVKTSEQP